MEYLVAMDPTMGTKFIVVLYCSSTGSIKLKQDNYFDALGSFIYLLWFPSMGPQRGREVSDEKGKDSNVKRNLKMSEEV